MKQLGCVGRQLGPLYDDPHSCILNRKIYIYIYIYSIFNIYSIGIGEDWIVNSNNNNNNNNNNKNKNSYNNSSFDNFPHWNLTKLDGW